MLTSSKTNNNIGADEHQRLPGPPNNPKPDSTTNKTTPPSPSASPSTAVDEAQMARTLSKHSAPSPSWFTPKRLLMMFCVINMLNYLDRGAIASNGVNGSISTCDDEGICTAGTGIQLRYTSGFLFGCEKGEYGQKSHTQAQYSHMLGDFKLNNFQDGVLSSAFMVGLLVASPIFASLSKSYNPFRLIGVGLSVWTFATAGCGSSFDFWSIAICRMLVGVGEASFISLAAPFIDDNAPVAQKTAWLAMFYMCIPTGIAVGYVYGGFVGSYLNWRYAFWIEALLMLPFAILGFVMKPLQLKGFAPVESKKALASETVVSLTEEASNGHVPVGNEDISNQVPEKVSKSLDANQFSRFAKDMKDLLVDKVYVVNVLGYILYNFVIGAYSYWGPKAGYNIYHMSNADMMFGGVTIICGILGTVSGGLILDRMNATISNAFKLLSGATFLGAIFCFTAFCIKSLYGFIALFAVGELLVFATQAPVNYVCLHCVKPSLRPLSMAISTVSIHIFGDVPSSPLVGIFQDHVNNWRTTALVLTSIFFPAAGVWFVGIFLKSVDRFNEETENQVSPYMKANMKPLLGENGDNVSEA